MKVPLKLTRIDSELESLPKMKAAFIEPMLLLRTEELPEGSEWIYGSSMVRRESLDRSDIEIT